MLVLDAVLAARALPTIEQPDESLQNAGIFIQIHKGHIFTNDAPGDIVESHAGFGLHVERDRYAAVGRR